MGVGVVTWRRRGSGGGGRGGAYAGEIRYALPLEEARVVGLTWGAWVGVSAGFSCRGGQVARKEDCTWSFWFPGLFTDCRGLCLEPFLG